MTISSHLPLKSRNNVADGAAQFDLYECGCERAADGANPRFSEGYLEALRRGMLASDVEISLSVACESPLYEGIVHGVGRSHPDLVVRGAAPGEPLDPNTWELVAECPTLLLLTRGRPWKVRPVIAAAVDVSPGESPELTRAILLAAAGFASMAGGTIEVMHAGGIESGSASECDGRRTALVGRARDAGVEGAECHLLAGEPAEALREFCARRDFDLVVLGALTHRNALGALVGTLTGRLIEAVESDFLPVKPARSRTNGA